MNSLVSNLNPCSANYELWQSAGYVISPRSGLLICKLEMIVLRQTVSCLLQSHYSFLPSFLVNKTGRSHSNSGKMGLASGLRGRYVSAFWSMRCKGSLQGSTGRRFSSWVKGSGGGEPLPVLPFASCFECSCVWISMHGTTAAISWLWGGRLGESRDTNPMS